MEISNKIWELASSAESALAEHFRRIDDIAFENTKKVMDAFREHRVSEAMFAPTSGYGYVRFIRKLLLCHIFIH